jgi:two-component system chemotaxis response regulator CheB
MSIATRGLFGMRNTVVIGASAGGVTALQEIVAGLRPGFPASVFIVLHLSPDAPSLLAELLDQASLIPVRTAHDGDPVEPGTVYVAPPDRHMTLEDNRVRISLGPKQDRHRPSVDVLFRSAARELGPQVIGVVLTGFLSDGTAGMRAIKERGGVTVVQDPRSAQHPGMVESALRNVSIDHCVALEEIPALLTRLVTAAPSAQAPAQPPSRALDFESAADLGKVGDISEVAEPSSFLCPDCSGGLWEVKADNLIRYRCRVGHGYSAESLLASQEPAVERALWAAVRSLEDRAALGERLADAWRPRRAPNLVDHFSRLAEQSHANAAAIRSLLGLKDERREHAPAADSATHTEREHQAMKGRG